ncbi:MAG: histidine kinase [Ginsengibacter sp.]
MKIVFIPLLGFFIPYISGIISYEKYSFNTLIFVFCYFVFVSFCIWQGCHVIHIKLRRFYAINLNPFNKIAAIGISSSIYAGIVACILCLLWMKFSLDKFQWLPLLRFIFFSAMAAVLFKLIYEVIYLSKERERDNIIVDQLDNELNRVEMIALRNELDPHFIFNSLNTLSYLIGKDDLKAQKFNSKLAEVYKYFLINKDKELITLDKEMEFIDNYMFLLQIRYDNKMELNVDLNGKDIHNILVIPCSVQLLIENAIKHTQFTNNDPLRIYISMDKFYLSIENAFKKGNSKHSSTKIGLKNLNAQYQLVLKKSIIVERLDKRFVVRLPLFKNALAG